MLDSMTWDCRQLHLISMLLPTRLRSFMKDGKLKTALYVCSLAYLLALMILSLFGKGEWLSFSSLFKLLDRAAGI